MSLFGQDGPGPDPCDAALRDLLAAPPAFPGSPLSARVMARNLSHDKRVPLEREAAFRASLPLPVTAAGLVDGVKRYHEDKILYQRRPEFVDEVLNERNIITHLIHKDRPLARLIDLNGLATLYDWAKPRLPDFPRFSPNRPPEYPPFVSWLNQRLSDPSPPRLRRFIESTLNVLNEYRAAVGPYQPSWATSWELFAPHLASPVERWLALLGMYKPIAGHWFIVLRYPVREAGTLARPTILDAGWEAHHFPSPLVAPLDEGYPPSPLAGPHGYGGHPMDLDLEAESDLLPEYIHDQADYRIQQWDAAGRLCRQAGGPTPAGLDAQRRKHHLLLKRRYGEKRVISWMLEPC
jgi:hypothetical protein